MIINNTDQLVFYTKELLKMTVRRDPVMKDAGLGNRSDDAYIRNVVDSVRYLEKYGYLRLRPAPVLDSDN